MSIKSRKHSIMGLRERQLRRNELAYNGGRPYIDERLWRAPNETDVSWDGDLKRGIVGRKDRTSLVNDAGRVVDKINQYIFKEEAKREGADADFLLNCTGDGESVHDFMGRVCSSITYGRWCWLQADRAPLAEGETETMADRAPIMWRLWDAIDVPDWCVGPDGAIKWLITRSHMVLNDDPTVPEKTGQLYTLYHLKDGVVHITEEADGFTMDGLRTDEPIPGLERIPFALIGRPSDRAWWFDDVENIQAQILNLDSLHGETLTETVYPQLVVPGNIINSLVPRLKEKSINGERVAELVRELTLGRRIPICESAEDKGISRYITPSGDLKLLTDEGTRKRSLLFEMAGLALFNKETRQVQTAESKQFDQLDTNSTLGRRAIMLQNAEKALVELSRIFDKNFMAWEPSYPSKFDVVDVAELSQALVQMSNMPDKTPKVKQIMAKVAVRILKELAAGIIPNAEFEDALAEIDKHDFSEPAMLPNPFGDDDDDGDDDE